MRNVFDQYSQYENRLTHALACSLEADRVLLRKFCRWVLDGNAPPSQRLRILEQQLPGEEEAADVFLLVVSRNAGAHSHGIGTLPWRRAQAQCRERDERRGPAEAP